ncbi:MAG: NAD(P)-dependent oxidoreductase [Bacteroidales bacterium]|nr:NAD(P)-dependent oxidoreductase [Bacteroidales bacterium]
MKKILVTGAGGFIGGYIVEKALKENFETFAGVRKTTSREFLQDERIKFIDIPFNDKDKLNAFLKKCKSEFGGWDIVIYNLGVTKCLDERDFERINYGFSRNFVDGLVENDLVPSQFIMMSSLSALGPGDEINMTPITCDDNPTPNTAYGRSKLKAENYIKSIDNFPYVFMRPTGVYGPHDKDYLLMVKTIKAGFDFVAGYKPQRITFIYVKDLVDCIFSVIKKGVVQKEYIVSEEADYSSSQFREYVQKELNKKFVIPVRVPLFILNVIANVSSIISKATGKPTALNRDKYNIMKQRNWRCDITPLKDELNFIPAYSLKDGVKETIAWYKENKWI